MTQNKVLGLFIFLNFVPKVLFLCTFGPKHGSPLFKMKLGAKGYSKVMILNSTIVFLNFVPKIALLGKCGL